jgi:hypothetical protein
MSSIFSDAMGCFISFNMLQASLTKWENAHLFALVYGMRASLVTIAYSPLAQIL